MSSPPKLLAARRPVGLRFTLRLLLAAMAALCIALGWWTQRARRQARIVAGIVKTYGTVTYDFEPQLTPKMYRRRSPLPAWLVERLGEDFFHSVVRAHVRGEVDLAQVSELTAITDLTIWKEDLTDETLLPIARLRGLKRLVIQSDKHQGLPGDYPDTTRITDGSLAGIAALPKLEEVYLDGTHFTAAGISELARSNSLRKVYVRCCDESVTAAASAPFDSAGRVTKLTIRKWTPGKGEEFVVQR